MTQQLMVCTACRDEGKNFIVPHDEIGTQLMIAHLNSEHGANL